MVAVLAAFPPSGGAGERELGERFMLEARAALPFIDDPSVTDVVRRNARRLVEQLGPQEFDYQFFVVRHPSLNAFAVPGGYIFIFSGLVARANSEDELVGVLAHEIAHIHAHHVVRQQAAGQVWTAAGLLGVLLSAVNPVLGAGAIAAAQTAQLKFSRDFEQEADYLGVRLAAESGYDPRALSGFFKHLLDEQRLNPSGVPPYMLSHPVTEDRVTNVEALIKAQNLSTPPGRPAAGLNMREARAVARALTEPAEVVIDSHRREVAAHPDDAGAHFLLGRTYQTVGQLEAARTALVQSEKLGVGPLVDRPLGSLYLALKEHDLARRHLEKHLAADPRDGWSRLELGKVLAATNDVDGSIREYRRAIDLDPELDEAHRLLGVTLGRRGDEEEGLYHLAMAARLRGDLVQALRHFQRVESLSEEGSARRAESEKAIEDLQEVVRDQAPPPTTRRPRRARW
jgi:predicted Zn-dependent protease